MANFGAVKYLLSLGTNLGDRKANIDNALHLIAAKCGEIDRVSSIYKTEPWGFHSDNWFYNVAIVVDSKLNPFELLDQLANIESSLGRERDQEPAETYQSRLIDIDILLADDIILETPSLTIPHKHMHERKFVLMPASEVAGEWNHPVLNLTVRALMARVVDRREVMPL